MIFVLLPIVYVILRKSDNAFEVIMTYSAHYDYYLSRIKKNFSFATTNFFFLQHFQIGLTTDDKNLIDYVFSWCLLTKKTIAYQRLVYRAIM